MPTAAGRRGGRWGVAEAQALLQMGMGRDEVATIECDSPHSQMALAHEGRVGRAVRQVEQLLGQRGRGRQPRLCAMEYIEAGCRAIRKACEALV